MVEIIVYPQRLYDRMVKNEKYKPEDFFLSIVHHSITEEDMPAKPHSLNVLFLKFDDVVVDALGNKAITKDQASRIMEFAKTIPDNSTLHIHCGAGVSRSTASSKAIQEILGDRKISSTEKRLGDSYHPNPTVYNLITESYKASHDTVQ